MAGAFDDLIPQGSEGAPAAPSDVFGDLIPPTAPATQPAAPGALAGGAFDDLVPSDPPVTAPNPAAALPPIDGEAVAMAAQRFGLRIPPPSAPMAIDPKALLEGAARVSPDAGIRESANFLLQNQAGIKHQAELEAMLPPDLDDAGFIQAFKNSRGLSENIAAAQWRTALEQRAATDPELAKRLLAQMSQDTELRDLIVSRIGERRPVAATAGSIARETVDPLNLLLSLTPGRVAKLPLTSMARQGFNALQGAGTGALSEVAAQDSRGGPRDLGAVVQSALLGGAIAPSVDLGVGGAGRVFERRAPVSPAADTAPAPPRVETPDAEPARAFDERRLFLPGEELPEPAQAEPPPAAGTVPEAEPVSLPNSRLEELERLSASAADPETQALLRGEAERLRARQDEEPPPSLEEVEALRPRKSEEPVADLSALQDEATLLDPDSVERLSDSLPPERAAVELQNIIDSARTRQTERAAVSERGGADVALYLPAGPVEQVNVRAQTMRELGPRVKHVETSRLPTGLTTIRSAEDLAHVLAPIRRDAQESLMAVMTDADGKVLRVARLHTGSADRAMVDTGLVAGVASSTPGAKRLWLGHNHPSGNVSQSAQDGALARQLARLMDGSGVEFAGSAVVGPGGRLSSVDAGRGARLIATTPAPRRESLPVTQRRLTGAPSGEPPVKSADDARAALAQQEGEGVLLLDARDQPVGWVPMSGEDMAPLRTGEGGGSSRLFKAIDESNASKLLVRSDDREAVRNLRAFGRQTGRPVVDAVNLRGEALSASGDDTPIRGTFYANPVNVAAKALMRDIGLEPARSAAAAGVGAVAGATTSDEKPGTPRWSADVALGGALAAIGATALRKTRVTGKGGVLDWGVDRIGAAVEKLPGFGRGPADLALLKTRARVMRELLDQEVGDVGKYLRDHFTPAERGQMADLIENKGIIKDFNVIHRQAEELDQAITKAADRLKALHLLPPELETGGYLHRYYRKYLLEGDDAFKEAKRQSLSGTYSLSRGTDDVFAREYLSPGVSDVVQRFEDLTAEIERLERRTGKKNAADIAKLKAERRQLAKTRFHEYVGGQNGEMRRFLFAADEVPVVPGDHPLGYLDGDKRVKRVGEFLSAPERGGLLDSGGKVPMANLQPTGRRWAVRAGQDDGVLMHRDWTKEERAAWGEIKDSGYRFVRGMNELSHDLSLGSLFHQVSKRSDWAKPAKSATDQVKAEWVLVPKTSVGKGAAMRRWGALADHYVRPDVWAAIRNHGRHPFGESWAAKLYLGTLQRWKAWKTVYNPVTHLNNLHSNAQMLSMNGYSPADLGRGVKALMGGKDSQLLKEAIEDGVLDPQRVSAMLGADGAKNSGLSDLAQQLLDQPEIPDAELVLSVGMKMKEWWINSAAALGEAKGPWQTGAALARAASSPAKVTLSPVTKPLKALGAASARLYRFEDEMFKMAVYHAERSRGTTRDAAAQAAQQLFFDYSALPDAVKIVRDLPLGSPFISYTYFAIPAIVRTMVRKPEYVLALAAAYEAVNYAGMAIDGLEPGEYWNVADAEDELSAPWDRGRAVWGARNSIHVPYVEGYRLALANAHAAGNVFNAESGNRRADLPFLPDWWGGDVFGSSPMRALLDLAMNEDWKGREIYPAGAPDGEKAHRMAAYLYQAWAPSNPMTPGGYAQTKILEGIANDARESAEKGEAAPLATAITKGANGASEALGFGQFTGLDRGDNPIVTRDALLAAFGIKLRPIDFEEGAGFARRDIERERQSKGKFRRTLDRDYDAGRQTVGQYVRRYEKSEDDEAELDDRAAKIDDAEAVLSSRGSVKPSPTR